MAEAKLVRKHAAQHDLFNRLHSIASDEASVRSIRDWFDGRFPIIPNQRCGNWYCDPAISSDLYAYFKSTDGHTNNWDFNLRRSNLSLAKAAEDHGGLIIVDSTRSGKRMPDALSKTIPIWCAVINRAVGEDKEWDTELYVKLSIVSPSEKAQIEARLPVWTASLLASPISLPELTKPIRPFFIDSSTSTLPQLPVDSPFTPIFCVSASRWTRGQAGDIHLSTRNGESTTSFLYVPGAGDDDELWARGLTPALFHANKARLLSTACDDLPSVVDDIVAEPRRPSTEKQISLSRDPASEKERQLVGIPSAHSMVALDLGPTIGSNPPWQSVSKPFNVVHVLQLDKLPKDVPALVSLTPTNSNSLVLLSDPRKDGKAYIHALGSAVEGVQNLLKDGPLVLAPGEFSSLRAVLNAQDHGLGTANIPVHDVSLEDARKVIIPLALALMCSMDGAVVGKEFIARQLQTMVALWPDSNPPRVALRKVNELLMSPDIR